MGASMHFTRSKHKALPVYFRRESGVYRAGASCLKEIWSRSWLGGVPRGNGGFVMLIRCDLLQIFGVGVYS